MKIAVCISGQLRKLEENLIATAFKDYDVDYYVHTWDHTFNPNLKIVKDYFPNAVIEIEKYEDTFDKFFDDDDVDKNRYQFAQFYTILKSLQLCATSGKKYDYYIRSRSDVMWPTHLWPDKVVNQLNLDAMAIITNSRTVKNRDSIEFATCEIPIVAVGIAGLENNMYALREWSWCMNQVAFDITIKNSPEQMVYIAKEIRDSFLQHSTHNSLQSPGIWGKFFEKSNMIIQNTSQFNTRLLRYPSSKKLEILHYGDIS
jgi:hypothetical protein